MLIEIDHVSKSYRRPFRESKPVLDSFYAQLPIGIHALLGPNGAGKTTLLRIVAGILSPGSGSVRFDGRNICELDAAYRQYLGYVPQSFGYYRQFTVQRFLEYLAELKCVPTNHRGARIDRVLAQTGLTERRKERIRRLSGGMRQRLGIAQALLNAPRILILDERTVGLDPAERMRFKGVLSALSSQCIILLSTHIVSDVEDLADDILLIQEGRCVAQGSPRALVNSLSGRVWTLRSPQGGTGWAAPGQIEPMTQLRDQVEGGHRMMRVFCESKPMRDAQPATATLEDLYMLHFGVKSDDSDVG